MLNHNDLASLPHSSTVNAIASPSWLGGRLGSMGLACPSSLLRLWALGGLGVAPGGREPEGRGVESYLS